MANIREQSVPSQPSRPKQTRKWLSEAETSFLEQGITILRQVVNVNLFVQELSVVLDYERISVNASQALTEANKMGPCLEPWNETVESCFVYVLILSFDQSIPHFSTPTIPHSPTTQLFHTFQLRIIYSTLPTPHYSPLGSPYIQRLYLHPTYSTSFLLRSSFPTSGYTQCNCLPHQFTTARFPQLPSLCQPKSFKHTEVGSNNSLNLDGMGTWLRSCSGISLVPMSSRFSRCTRRSLDSMKN